MKKAELQAIIDKRIGTSDYAIDQVPAVRDAFEAWLRAESEIELATTRHRAALYSQSSRDNDSSCEIDETLNDAVTRVQKAYMTAQEADRAYWIARGEAIAQRSAARNE